MRHAFLIMAHNEPEILNVLMDKLSHIDGQMFVHIDKKVKGQMFDSLSRMVSLHHGILLAKRVNVVWGDYSQIACELALYQKAVRGGFDYYHMLSGVDLPIKSATYISEFFEQQKGQEFFEVACDQYNVEDIYRKTNLYHLFQRYNRSKIGNVIQRFKIKKFSEHIQKSIGVSRCKRDEQRLYKGGNWMSLTDSAVRYLLSKESFVRRRFRFTCCPDEIFAQTILMNSPFKDKRYNPVKNESSSLRLIDWKRGAPYVWTNDDKEQIMSSDNLFARKFSTAKDKQIIDYIKENI